MRPLTVTETNLYVKNLFASDMITSDIKIEGEISNFNHHYSGHMYFSLKDKNSRIKSVMFKGNNSNLNMVPKEGMKVVARGYISLYEKEGEYQFYVRDMEEDGLGDLYKKYLDLKEKLEDEGLFDEDRKRKIPEYPRNIGIITSKTGAAVRDILNVINRRNSSVNVFLYPSLVQGTEAPKNLIKGIEYFNKRKDIDLVIIGRGGGAMEELFAFNDEKLARKIYASKKPIISAVGHEVDYTIADYVADLRAATPTEAGELAVQRMDRLKGDLKNRFREVLYSYEGVLDEKKLDLKDLNHRIKLSSPQNKILENRQTLDNLFRSMTLSLERDIYEKKNRLMQVKHVLDIKNPMLGLDQGNGILMDEDGKILRSVKDIVVDKNIDILLKDGSVKALVLSKDEGGL